MFQQSFRYLIESVGLPIRFGRNYGKLIDRALLPIKFRQNYGKLIDRTLLPIKFGRNYGKLIDRAWLSINCSGFSLNLIDRTNTVALCAIIKITCLQFQPARHQSSLKFRDNDQKALTHHHLWYNAFQSSPLRYVLLFLNL